MAVTRQATSSFWNIRNILILVWCLIAVSGVGLVTAAQIGIDSEPGVMQGVTIGGYSVSGSSYQEVAESMTRIASQMEAQPVALTGLEDRPIATARRSSGVTVDAEAMANEAYRICRTGNLLENAWDYWRLKLLHYEITPV
jgi:hypothetical protein